MNIDELKTRFKKWAISVILLTRKLTFDPEYKAIRNQIVRSAPSAAANYRSACRAKSGPDFINKMKIVEEELDESLFWLEIIIELLPSLENDITPIYKEGEELLKISVASLKTARK